jgi:deoxycitidine kinase/deoxyguanosine kinase
MQPIIITLDGNIGAGKSTLLDAIKTHLPNVTVIPEPVGEWLTMTNQHGESLLKLFYKDKQRWGYTFQNAAILTRLLDTQHILKEWKPEAGKLPVIITERSVLTDRYVFADMLHDDGKLDDLEWRLYLKWYEAYAKDLPIKGIIHLNTSARTSSDRIKIRGREGEECIELAYLEQLDAQHSKWVESTDLPCLQIHSEPGSSLKEVVSAIEEWILKTFVKGKLE